MLGLTMLGLLMAPKFVETATHGGKVAAAKTSEMKNLRFIASPQR
jgi:hypothetical protein